MSAKLGLIIANTEYTDSGLAQLSAPSHDAEEFARILRSPEICQFDDVKVLLNETSYSATEAIDEFFEQKKPDDLLLLYFSGHGVRDELGSLFLAVRNTNRFRLRSTAIKSDFIRESMDQSRSRRQILILDCCNSGAFAQGTKAATGMSIGTGPVFEGTGYGRVILTASDSTQFAWEGDRIIGKTENSLFTHFLIQGLKGEADLNSDGRITVDELYDYSFSQILNVTPKQTPSKWSYKEQGEIILRESIPIEYIKSMPLPEELLDEIDDPRPYVRQAAVEKLEKLAKGKNIGVARTARDVLEKMAAEDDSIRIRQAALQSLMTTRQALEKTAQTQKTHQETDRKQEGEVEHFVTQEAQSGLPSTKDTLDGNLKIRAEIQAEPPGELEKTPPPKAEDAQKVVQSQYVSPQISGDQILEDEKLKVTSGTTTRTVEKQPKIESENKTFNKKASPKKSRLLPIALAGGFIIIIALCGYMALRSFLSMLVASTPTSTDDVTTRIAATQTVPVTETLVDAPVSTPTVRSTQTPRPTKSPTLQPREFFTEEFDTPLSGDWSVFTITDPSLSDLSKVTVEANNGNLVWNLNSQYIYYYLFYNAFNYEDVKVEARAENQGRNNNSVSLICRYNEEIGWYEFNIANNGLYDILFAEVLDSGKVRWNRIANGGSNAIKQGQNINDYMIICRGNELTLYINGDNVISVSEEKYGLQSGQTGISVSSFNVLPILIEMDVIKISEP